MTSFETSVIETVMQTTMSRTEAREKLPLRMELEAVEGKLRELLTKTILEDENASVILYGYPGQGKSLVVDRAIGRLQWECNSNEENVLCRVDLNGAIDGDKKEGFKAIARQLCRFLEVEFLSHASAEQNIQFLKEALQRLHRAEMSCVFVLDGLEKFVKDSEKQEIVYTLLDALQSRSVRACVIGLTTDFRIKNDFDKRVHSRFSHKSWIVPKCDDLFGVLKATMIVSMPEKKDTTIETYNRSVEDALGDPTMQPYMDMCRGWLSPRDIGHVALSAIINATTRSATPFAVEANDIGYAFEQCIKQHDPLPVKIAELSAPQLYTLVSCALTESRFAPKAVFARYEGFIRKQSTSDVFEEPIMIHAFYDLLRSDLIVRIKETRRGWSTSSVLESYALNVTKEEIHRGISVNPFASTVLHAFFKSE